MIINRYCSLSCEKLIEEVIIQNQIGKHTHRYPVEDTVVLLQLRYKDLIAVRLHAAMRRYEPENAEVTANVNQK